jgi:hypothetical protein
VPSPEYAITVLMIPIVAFVLKTILPDICNVITFTVTSSTLLATYDEAQSTRAKRLYHVVTVRGPASYVAALLIAMSLNPELLLVVEDCHLYSIVPVSPLGALALVKAAGLNGDIPLCAAAITPALVGFTQSATPGVNKPNITLSPRPSPPPNCACASSIPIIHSNITNKVADQLQYRTLR